MQNKIRLLIKCLILCSCFLAAWAIQNTTFWYEEPIMQVQQASIEEEQQVIKGELMNTEAKGTILTLSVPYQENQIEHAKVQPDQLYLVRKIGDEWQIMSKKNDGWMFLFTSLFICALLFIGGKAGVFTLVSVGLNLFLLIFLLQGFTQTQGISLVMTSMLFVFLGTIIGVFALDGWQKSGLVKIVATISSVGIAFLICLLVMEYLNDNGLRYEEMSYLTRPYRSVFLASLLVGMTGGVLDTVVTVTTTLDELVSKQPNLTMKRLWQSGQMVGQDVIGSMTNILLFVYISGTIPMLLVYFSNGWPLRDAIELHLSLELLRVISGSLGIVLSIPISLLCYLGHLNYRRASR
ncbi:YibE/F family protein [Enterococcus sp. DIV1298c]|uniref:YibE/F family protein n=1 Tax=Enterococcus sp. DIV1298c TaxID=2815328 RepID=UPI001A938573|nr:YibE/F family protein [Enterococcus sp. DIV1298c]MBO0460681.1 YibE/F family protein [Enterococcus sp. DIV1298c]